jgi:hypothetical protein
MTKLPIFAIVLLVFCNGASAQYGWSRNSNSYSGASRSGYSDAARFGIRAGINLSKLEGEDSYYYDYDYYLESDYTLQTANRIGFHIGVVADVMVSEFLYFQPGIMLSSKGGEGNKTEKSETYYEKSSQAYNLYYLEFPLLLSLKGTLSKDLALRVSGGPYIDIGLFGTHEWEYEERHSGLIFDSGKFDMMDIFSPSKTEEERMGKGFDRLNFGISLGAGIEFGNLYFGMSYNMGLTNLQKDDLKKTETGKIWERTTSFTAGYNF